MTPSATAPRVAKRRTPAASAWARAVSGRVPWRAEMLGLGLALLLAGAFIALLLGAMETAQTRRLEAAAAQRVLMACESQPLARGRLACRLALQKPAVASSGLPQRVAGS